MAFSRDTQEDDYWRGYTNESWMKYNAGMPKQCRHKGCSECHGSGRKKNGEICVHMLSCDCKQCSPGRM